MFYSGGGVKAENGVAVELMNDIVKLLTNVKCYRDRLIFVKISAKPVDIVLVQVYMPTINHDDDEIEKLYEEIRNTGPKSKRSSECNSDGRLQQDRGRMIYR